MLALWSRSPRRRSRSLLSLSLALFLSVYIYICIYMTLSHTLILSLSHSSSGGASICGMYTCPSILLLALWLRSPRRRSRSLLELFSDDLTRISSDKLPNFQTLSVNFCTRISFKRTDRAVNINLYYTSSLVRLLALWPRNPRRRSRLLPPATTLNPEP